MAAPQIIKQIYASKKVTDETGKTHDLHSEINPYEGEFIWKLIRNNEIQHSIEVGCAFGLSSLFICDALCCKAAPRHVIIDPNQFSDYHGVGIYQLKKAEFLFFELIEQPSEIALPELLKRGENYDFAFIDGWHTFDHALLDFFYINRLLKVKGIVVFDDVLWPSINKLLRYISQYPNYEIIGSVPYCNSIPGSLRHRLSDKFHDILSNLIKPIPERITRPIFADSLIRRDKSLGLKVSMIALQKVTEDNRNLFWFVPF